VLLKEQLWILKNNGGLNLSRIITLGFVRFFLWAGHCANLFVCNTNSNPYNSLVKKKLLVAFYKRRN